MTQWKDLWFTQEAENRFNASLQGMKFDFYTGKIHPRNIEAATEMNWVFFGDANRSMDCGLWHGTFFKHYNLVPSYCRLRCYKVVVKIPTVETLMRFHNFIQSTPERLEICVPLYGKCGIDERYYTDTPYDAFFYCDGLEDGLDRYQLVHDLIRDHFTFAPTLPILLKRSCTEFEQTHGPTTGGYWQGLSRDDRDLERRLNDIYADQKYEVRQPGWLINKIYRRWIKFANTFGDKTWLNYYPDMGDFTVKAETYQHLLDEREEKKPETLGKLYSQVAREHPLEYPNWAELDERTNIETVGDAQITPLRKE